MYPEKKIVNLDRNSVVKSQCQQLTESARQVYATVMDMTSLNISLPVEMKQFIETKTSSGGYGTASEYIRELVRADQKKEADLKETEEQVVAMLLEGVRQLERGETVEVTPEFWQQKRQQLLNRFGNKNRA
jgi:antitoxin ParD1/3/4